MNDDLVKRLRLGACALEIEQAADRIEELTAERDEALNQLDSARHSVDVLERRLTDKLTNLAKAVEALERIEDASRYFGSNPEASETTVRYAHETTRRLCSTTLAELNSVSCANLKGEKDE